MTKIDLCLSQSKFPWDSALIGAATHDDFVCEGSETFPMKSASICPKPATTLK
jgi:hypothetical protein